MATLKDVTGEVTGNLLGAAAGAVGGWFLAKKVIKTEKTWVLVGAILATAVAGALAQAAIKAKKSAPTAADVKK